MTNALFQLYDFDIDVESMAASFLFHCSTGICIFYSRLDVYIPKQARHERARQALRLITFTTVGIMVRNGRGRLWHVGSSHGGGILYCCINRPATYGTVPSKRHMEGEKGTRQKDRRKSTAGEENIMGMIVVLRMFK